MKEYKGCLTVLDARIGIVVSRFNEFITHSLFNGALNCLDRLGVPKNNLVTAWVPGAFEIPLVAKRMALTGQVEVIICLGAVIRGETPHFDYVAAQVAAGIMQVTLETHVPAIFGLLTTDTIAQAIERAGSKSGNKGEEAAQTALEMIDLLRQLPVGRD